MFLRWISRSTFLKKPARRIQCLYVYVGNNPLKYIDPTGHVKETPEQEAIEEGAVGGVGCATIGVVVFVTEGLGCVVQL
jgi:hypothetical protein